MKTIIFCVAALMILDSALAIELTPALKAEIARGMNAATSAIGPGQALPTSAIQVLIKEQKRHTKKSDAFKLGFAQGAVSWMHVAKQHALSLPIVEIEQARTGWTIFSSEATILQIRLKLTDAQMVELFGARAAAELKEF